tara:strand:+ start:48 stop:236 length:189 start_codon:yes stop_codon:yes gene_type:complete
MHWFFILLGILPLSMSISNPVYKLFIKKRIKTNNFIDILLRILFFFISIFLIFFGLYLESIL